MTVLGTVVKTGREAEHYCGGTGRRSASGAGRHKKTARNGAFRAAYTVVFKTGCMEIKK